MQMIINPCFPIRLTMELGSMMMEASWKLIQKIEDDDENLSKRFFFMKERLNLIFYTYTYCNIFLHYVLFFF